MTIDRLRFKTRGLMKKGHPHRRNSDPHAEQMLKPLTAFETPKLDLIASAARLSVCKIGNPCFPSVGPALIRDELVDGDIAMYKFQVEIRRCISSTFMGVSDSTVPLTAQHGGRSHGFDVVTGEVVCSANSHLSRVGSIPEPIEKPMITAIIAMTVNMRERSLSISVDEQPARRADISALPAAVRPWVWLCWPGDSITLIEQRRLNQLPARAPLIEFDERSTTTLDSERSTGDSSESSSRPPSAMSREGASEVQSQRVVQSL